MRGPAAACSQSVAVAEARAASGAAPPLDCLAANRTARHAASSDAAHVRRADPHGAEFGYAPQGAAALLAAPAVAAGAVTARGGGESGCKDEEEEGDSSHSRGVTHAESRCKYGAGPEPDPVPEPAQPVL